MTLIATFWCAGNQAVLCADSEECSGEFKTSVTKIKPKEFRLCCLGHSEGLV